jgi:hypothetical protein
LLRDAATASRRPGVQGRSGSGDGSALGSAVALPALPDAADAAEGTATAAAAAADDDAAAADDDAADADALSGRPCEPAGGCGACVRVVAAVPSRCRAAALPPAAGLARFLCGGAPDRLAAGLAFLRVAAWPVWAPRGRFLAGGSANCRSARGTSAGFVRVSATEAASAADRRTRPPPLLLPDDMAAVRRCSLRPLVQLGGSRPVRLGCSARRLLSRPPTTVEAAASISHQGQSHAGCRL